MQRWKGLERKRQTPSAQPSQHVPITAALKQSPARGFCWRAGGAERERDRRREILEICCDGRGAIKGEQRGGERVAVVYEKVGDRWKLGTKERERKANEGTNQSESENIGAPEVAGREKERDSSTLQWALVRDDQSAKLSWVNKQGPSLQVQFLPWLSTANTHRPNLYTQCVPHLLIWKLENLRLIPICCTQLSAAHQNRKNSGLSGFFMLQNQSFSEKISLPLVMEVLDHPIQSTNFRNIIKKKKKIKGLYLWDP